jgi:hypothetical protein
MDPKFLWFSFGFCTCLVAVSPWLLVLSQRGGRS